MSGEARKLHMIEALLQERDEKVLSVIESLLLKNNDKALDKNSFASFAGTLTDDEADEWLKNIEESCEQIHPDDWK